MNYMNNIDKDPFGWLISLMPDGNDIEERGNGVFGVTGRIPDIDLLYRYQQDMEDHVAIMWLEMSRQLADKMAKIGLQNCNKYLVTNYSADIVRRDRELTLVLRCEAFVAETRDIVVPEFVYGQCNWIPEEWKCGRCGMPNPMEAHYCGETMEPAGCGAPRARLIGEY